MDPEVSFIPLRGAPHCGCSRTTDGVFIQRCPLYGSGGVLYSVKRGSPLYGCSRTTDDVFIQKCPLIKRACTVFPFPFDYDQIMLLPWSYRATDYARIRPSPGDTDHACIIVTSL